jgi:ornithine cyclodeaminase/alanine dehydrogenase-like protein (mu-crystallin family)
MRTLLVSHREVANLLPMRECIEAMADAFRSLSIGDARLPLRQVISIPGTPNLLALMPGQLGVASRDRSRSAIGAKVITVFPGNDATPLDSHLGVVLLFEAEMGRLLAIIDASSVTAIRTAAVSGVATKLLSTPDAGDLAILGAGVQAMTHLEAMHSVRTIRRVRVWSRTAERRDAFVGKAQKKFGIAVEAVSTPEAAVTGADLVCTVTASREPVLRGGWLAPGAHVNAVGSALPAARELDTAAVVRSRLYVDRRESALAEAGDVLIPMSEGAINADHIRGDLGEVLMGAVAGRESANDITLFKSLGLAIEDLAAARHIYEKGVARGTGVWLSLGGLRDAK